MLAIPHNAKLFICQHPINMQKSFDGLSAVVGDLFPEGLTTGALFVFFNRRRDHIKVLFWGNDGLAIWFKRLEKGSFAWNWESSSSLNRKGLLILLEGITPKTSPSERLDPGPLDARTGCFLEIPLVARLGSSFIHWSRPAGAWV